jgi:hypothetical protein
MDDDVITLDPKRLSNQREENRMCTGTTAIESDPMRAEEYLSTLAGN